MRGMVSDYMSSEENIHVTDYDQWKQWFDKWDVEYTEKTWNVGSKELVMRGHYCLASAAFDLDGNFICLTAYE